MSLFFDGANLRIWCIVAMLFAPILIVSTVGGIALSYAQQSRKQQGQQRWKGGIFKNVITGDTHIIVQPCDENDSTPGWGYSR